MPQTSPMEPQNLPTPNLREQTASLGRGAHGFETRLHEATTQRYRACAVSHRHFVRNKLRFDPLYRAIVHSPAMTHGGRLIDVGCGRGILLALLDTARDSAGTLEPPPGWRPPPAGLELWGVELQTEMAAVARTALGDAARIVAGDAAHEPLPAARTILLFDVLHYLSASDQERLLERAVTALEPGGTLIIREADAALDLRFALTRLAERLCALGRGHWRQRFHYRSTGDWRRLAENAGLRAEESPMWAGTPFANRLLEIRKPYEVK